MHCLAATEHRGGGDSADAGRWGGWDRFAPASPWSWSDLPRELPFDAESITAHAVHPRDRDVFVSAGGWEADDVGTFSYGEASGEWTRRGDWVLPFAGHGHYDGELDAWVGLHAAAAAAADDDDVGTDGRICACRVVTSTHQATDGPPEWKVAAEKLLLDDPEWRHVDATLVHMAERCECGLVERLRRRGEGDDDEEESLGDGDKRLLRLTTVRVRYGEDGELTATASRPARSYKVSRHQKSFDAQAFWM